MFLISSEFKRFGAETPTNTSAFLIASFKEPFSLFGFVRLIISLFASVNPSCPISKTPYLSQATIFLAPAFKRSFVIAVPAAPIPLTTILTSSIFFLTTFKAFRTPDKTTTAVPCWSSWKTGISSSFFNLASISKHLGAAISSRFIPPSPGLISLIVLTISSTSLVSKTIGIASTFPNSLNNTA